MHCKLFIPGRFFWPSFLSFQEILTNEQPPVGAVALVNKKRYAKDMQKICCGYPAAYLENERCSTRNRTSNVRFTNSVQIHCQIHITKLGQLQETEKMWCQLTWLRGKNRPKFLTYQTMWVSCRFLDLLFPV